MLPSPVKLCLSECGIFRDLQLPIIPFFMTWLREHSCWDFRLTSALIVPDAAKEYHARPRLRNNRSMTRGGRYGENFREAHREGLSEVEESL